MKLQIPQSHEDQIPQMLESIGLRLTGAFTADRTHITGTIDRCPDCQERAVVIIRGEGAFCAAHGLEHLRRGGGF